MIKVPTVAETSELDLLIRIKVVPPRYLFSFCVCAHFLQMSTNGDRTETERMIVMVKMMMRMQITRIMRISKGKAAKKICSFLVGFYY